LTCPFNAAFDVPFNATSSRPFNATLSRPFNALSDAPLQRVVVARLFFFNALFDVPFNVLSTCTLQCVLDAAHPSTRHVCALHRDVVAPFNSLSSRAIPRVDVRISTTCLCAHHSPHCQRALSRYVDVPFYCIAVE
jgi:hypothetical protein